MTALTPPERWWSGWRLLVAGMLFGAAMGWLIHRLRPPVYEAQVTFNIAVDYAATGSLEERETDQLLGTAGWLLTAGTVISQTATRAQAQGWPVDAATLRQRVFVERLQNRWVVRVRDTDPQRAAQLANWIGELGLNQLQDVYRHAVRAHLLRQHLQRLETCLAHQALFPPGRPPACNLLPLPSLSAEMDAAAQALAAETLASHGLVPALTYGVLAWATPPAQPVLYGRATMLLVGAALGFWVAAAWLALGRRHA